MLGSILKKIGLNIYSKGNRTDTTPLLIEELGVKYKNACHFLIHHLGPQNLGDYLEFGICHGTSLHCMFQTFKDLKLHSVRIFGFDSFEGLPAIELIKNGWQSKAFVNGLEFSTRIMTYNNSDWAQTFLIKGWYNETLTEKLKESHEIKKVSLVKIDCAHYDATKESLHFCASLIKDTTIIFFGSWIDEEDGQKKAFAEFLKENPGLRSFEFDNYNRGKVYVVNKVD